MKARDKRFLNNSFDEGAVSWTLKSGKDKPYGEFVTAYLLISDCSKSVELDFCCENYKHVGKRIDKLDNLIDSLNDLREALVQAKKEDDKKRSVF